MKYHVEFKDWLEKIESLFIPSEENKNTLKEEKVIHMVATFVIFHDQNEVKFVFDSKMENWEYTRGRVQEYFRDDNNWKGITEVFLLTKTTVENEEFLEAIHYYNPNGLRTNYSYAMVVKEFFWSLDHFIQALQNSTIIVNYSTTVVIIFK